MPMLSIIGCGVSIVQFLYITTKTFFRVADGTKIKYSIYIVITNPNQSFELSKGYHLKIMFHNDSDVVHHVLRFINSSVAKPPTVPTQSRKSTKTTTAGNHCNRTRTVLLCKAF